MTPDKPSPESIEKDRAELRKLEEKLTTVNDPDIIAVLNIRIEQLRSSLPALPVEPKAEDAMPVQPAEEPLPEPATPQQIEQAESFLRQARVEKMRNNTQAAAELVRQAVAVAPGAPAVLEALGDDAAERHNYKEARSAYERALKLAPGNVALERKHAESVLRSAGGMSIEQQLRMGMSDSPFLNAEDQIAGRKAAMLLNAFFPGVGQLVIGQTTKGAAFLGLWVLSLAGMLMLREDFTAIMRAVFAADSTAKPTYVSMLPLFGAAAIYVIALVDLRGKGEQPTRIKVDHPKPPVNLPFE